MIIVFESENELVKQLVDSIYIFRKGESGVEFIAYPSVNIPVALLRNATINIKDRGIFVENSDKTDYCAMACNQFYSSAHLRYPKLVDEIAINFKPLGFVSYTGAKPENSKIFPFRQWDKFLPELFHLVFGTDNQELQFHYIEQFLIERYVPLPDERNLLKTLELLSDTTIDYKLQDIADIIGIHYKQLYRLFSANVGCSPKRYQKLTKFRNSVRSKLKDGCKSRLVDICYEHDYTDQPYFIKQFKELTGEKPTHFFKEITSFGNEKVIFKIRYPDV